MPTRNQVFVLKLVRMMTLLLDGSICIEQIYLINKQKELYKNIESLWLDATNAQEQYAAAESKLKSSQASYEMVSEQFNLGMKNTVELLTEKNNLLSAQQQRIQAKYMAILDRTLLNFYAGQDIKL